MNADDDFYEDDEPAEKVWAAFERGEKRVTTRPAMGFDVRTGQKFRMTGNVIRPGLAVSRAAGR